ncbi:MAG: hypothetical protein AABZ02_03415, partial [Bacteroidota bacterium]
MKSLTLTNVLGNQGGKWHRMVPLLANVLFLAVALLAPSAAAAEDLLKAKFVEKLNSVVRSSDAVVGVAIKELKSGEEFVINGDEIFPQASSIK